MRHLAVLALACGCDTVEVRACNATSHDFATLTFGGFPNGPLTDGACTAYQRSEHDAYSQERVDVTIGTDAFEVLPIDFVGEDPRLRRGARDGGADPQDGLRGLQDAPAGRWSYRVTIADDDRRRVDIEAIAD